MTKIVAGTYEGIHNTLIDENGNEIKYVYSWDTESKIAEIYEDSSKPDLKKVHLPNARLIPVEQPRNDL